jgi:hypothetical protein
MFNSFGLIAIAVFASALLTYVVSSSSEWHDSRTGDWLHTSPQSVVTHARPAVTRDDARRYSPSLR